MNKDKALEELFLEHKPHFDDSDAFMASLAKRLDVVEYIKQHQEATIRRYKMAIFVALVVGIVSGVITMVFLLSRPLMYLCSRSSGKTATTRYRPCCCGSVRIPG